MDSKIAEVIAQILAGASFEITPPPPPVPMLEWKPIWPESDNQDEIDLSARLPEVVSAPAPPTTVRDLLAPSDPSPAEKDSLDEMFDSSPTRVITPSSSSVSIIGENKGKKPMTGGSQRMTRKRKLMLTTDSATPASKRTATRKSVRHLSKDVVMDVAPETVDMSDRSLVKEVVFETNFLRDNSLGELLDLLQFQKWENVFGVESRVCADVVRNFYGSFTIEKKGKGLVGTYIIDGMPQVFTSADLAKILNVPHDGYGEYTGKTWPLEIDEAEVMRVIGQTRKPGKTIPVNQMSVTVRLLHSFLVKNVVPRGEKGSVLQIQEAVLMFKIMRKEKVNLPMIIMLHMAHIRDQGKHRLGYPSIVKRIMKSHGTYQPSEDEGEWSRTLDEGTIKQMGFYFRQERGWGRDVCEPSASAPPVGSNSNLSAPLMEEFAKLHARHDDMERSLILLAEKFAEIRQILLQLSSQIGPSGSAPVA